MEYILTRQAMYV